ncbi:hypothetical protein AB1Y20_012550 [Prymnesium parvum]|uniref:Hexosyltransferase n=1 Tax=Prymnesium parvum TaxID=97485 RepID=A0AB34IJQ9_PRYPA
MLQWLLLFAVAPKLLRPCLSVNGTLERLPRLDTTPPELGVIHVAFFDTRRSPDVTSMRLAARLCRSSRSTLRFHALLTVPLEIPGFTVTVIRLPPRAQCVYDSLSRLAHGPGPQYLYKPLLPWVLPPHVHKLIVLDTDVVVLRDMQRLWGEFDSFGKALIGIANEQSLLYQRESGWRAVGKNGGVQLLDLQAMRMSAEYAAALDYVGSGQAGVRIGYLGDQSLYTWLAASWSSWRHLFHTLPCEWNRQLSMHFGFNNASVHRCHGSCALLHANWQPVKCIARYMQQSPLCSTWQAFQQQLASPSAWNNAAASGSPCAYKRSYPGWAPDFKRGISRFFSDCCIRG